MRVRRIQYLCNNIEKKKKTDVSTFIYQHAWVVSFFNFFYCSIYNKINVIDLRSFFFFFSKCVSNISYLKIVLLKSWQFYYNRYNWKLRLYCLEFNNSVRYIRKGAFIDIISLRNTLKQQLLCKKPLFPWRKLGKV